MNAQSLSFPWLRLDRVAHQQRSSSNPEDRRAIWRKTPHQKGIWQKWQKKSVRVLGMGCGGVMPARQNCCLGRARARSAAVFPCTSKWPKNPGVYPPLTFPKQEPPSPPSPPLIFLCVARKKICLVGEARHAPGIVGDARVYGRSTVFRLRPWMK